jgi:hypothetical protein
MTKALFFSNTDLNSLISSTKFTGNDLTVSTNDTVINSYSYITDSTINAGTTTVNVETTSGFSLGDDILIYQTQNISSDPVGHFEYRTIESIGTNQITFTSGLSNDYVSNQPDVYPAKTTQLIKVAVHSTLTINGSVTCTAWDGKKGGVVAIKCNTLQGSGIIHANNRGFRGGHYGTGNESPGFAGEGLYGGGGIMVNGRISATANILRYPHGRINTGGGGGEGASHAGSGGGGGGHIEKGGYGRCYYGGHENVGGSKAPLAKGRMFFGGGGGGGGDDDDSASNSWGGHGGGIVSIMCDNISETLDIQSKGENNSSSPPIVDGLPSQGAAKGSGGAGGTIIISKKCSATLDVSGGLGYINTATGNIAFGGSGSIGRIMLFNYQTLA